MAAPQDFNATVVARRDLNDRLWAFRVRPDAGVGPFLAGQYATLGLPDPSLPAAEGGKVKWTRRAYSIASSPSDRDGIEFFVVVVDDGQFTPRLHALREGDRIWIDPKIRGEFTLEHVPSGRDLVMVSTGTGLAPFVSMLRTYRDAPHWRRLVLINGARSQAELGYHEELLEAARTIPSLQYIPVVSREPANSGWTGLRGRVYAAFESHSYRQVGDLELNPECCHVLLCGNPEMIKEIQARLLERNFKLHSKRDPGNIHYEKYW